MARMKPVLNRRVVLSVRRDINRALSILDEACRVEEAVEADRLVGLECPMQLGST